jgi:hypothetical protein
MSGMKASELITTEFPKLKALEMMSIFTETDILYVLNVGDGTYTATYNSGKYPKTFVNIRDILRTINEPVAIVELPDGRMFVSGE